MTSGSLGGAVFDEILLFLVDTTEGFAEVDDLAVSHEYRFEEDNHGVGEFFDFNFCHSMVLDRTRASFRRGSSTIPSVWCGIRHRHIVRMLQPIP